jgi:hypothetical protein
MEFKATMVQWPPVKGAAIQIQWLNYDGAGQHRMIQCGDLFPVFFVNPRKRAANAKVVAFHHQGNVVLEFGDASRWHIRIIPWYPALQIEAGASASLWEFEQPVK